MSAVPALASVLLAAAPLPPATLVLDCYVVQSNQPEMGQFVRHLEVHPDRGVVVVADAVRGEPPRFIGNGRLIAAGADRLVFDFASSLSSGRTEIDRHSGAYRYSDGRAVVSGTCQTNDSRR